MVDLGQIDPRYEVLRVVSDGRRATVLKALDTVHGWPVALKVYPTAGDDREAMLAESHVLMAVHPHRSLPRVQGDFFTPDGANYVMVMSWADGVDLQDLLDQEGDPGLPLDDVVDYLGQIADALDHIHAHHPPIVHGDVKPGNVIRSASGQVVLVDFDISGLQVESGRAGTTGFVAPEVAAGDKPSPASDVYGLAATAVALLTGRTADDGTGWDAGGDLATTAALTRQLKLALSADPERRPHSASKLIHGLRSVAREQPPTGVVAVLALAVADAGRLWADDPAEMQVALDRLGDIQAQVVRDRGGVIATAMNVADQTVALFREVSSAALAALDLHERTAATVFPPGCELQLQIGICVGEVRMANATHTGAVIDQVVRLRSAARPSTTITTESTAEMLVGLAGRDLSIVPLGIVEHPELRRGQPVFALVRPGQEQLATVFVPQQQPPTPHAIPPQVLAEVPTAVDPEPPRRREALAAASLDTVTLTLLTVFGVLAIFRFVVADELNLGVLAGLLMMLAGACLLGGWAVLYQRHHRAQLAAFQSSEREREDAAVTRTVVEEQLAARRRLASGFEAVHTTDGRRGAEVLATLADEFDASTELFNRQRQGASTGLSATVDQTYRLGMGALSDALALLEASSDTRRAALSVELLEIDDRLAGVIDPEAGTGSAADHERRQVVQRRLARHDEALDHARSLISGAEWCTATIADARGELAAALAGDTHADVSTAVGMLEITIRRVRSVRDEMRRLDH